MKSVTHITEKDRLFAIEEYRECRAIIRHHQNAYMTLENYVFGSVVITYGVLFGISSNTNIYDIPSFVWWGLVLLIFFAFIRCWAHYVAVRRVSSYVLRLEDVLYSPESPIRGFEHIHTQSTAGPHALLVVNALSWSVLAGFSLVEAVQHTQAIGHP